MIEAGDPSERINPQPCVPSVVNTCIKYIAHILDRVPHYSTCRYLELHGLNTVGIFRVSSSKKRVRQVCLYKIRITFSTLYIGSYEKTLIVEQM